MFNQSKIDNEQRMDDFCCRGTSSGHATRRKLRRRAHHFIGDPYSGDLESAKVSGVVLVNRATWKPSHGLWSSSFREPVRRYPRRKEEGLVVLVQR